MIYSDKHYWAERLLKNRKGKTRKIGLSNGVNTTSAFAFKRGRHWLWGPKKYENDFMLPYIVSGYGNKK